MGIEQLTLSHRKGKYMQADYQQLLKQQRQYFATGVTRDIGFRVEMLQRLKGWMKTHEAKIMAALQEDLGKGQFESYVSEIMGSLEEIDLAVKKIKAWAKPRKVKTPLTLFKASSQIVYEPFGCVLVISPWNYPFGLSITVLIGAIAAGNCCVIKPSEFACHTSALIATMVKACFDEAYCTVAQGGVEETTMLLKERFDFIHFTGSTQVGKIVAVAAAKNLIPVVLELGGKSPCIVDETADIEISARRICWGKLMNAGQTCIAPDFIVVHEKVKAALLEALKRQIHAFYGDDPQQSEDYGRIINQNHFERLSALLNDGQIICGGQTDQSQRYIAPTVIDGVTWDDAIMKSEIFGPLLPVLVYDDLSQLIAILKQREKPLALYLFSKNKETQRKVVNELQFGGGCINATILHVANSALPFGGVGNSGMGSYHGAWSFETFSHRKSILNKSFMFDLKLLYPPYKNKLRWIRKV